MSTSSCRAQSNLVSRPKRPLLSVVALNDLPASDRELAEELEIWPLISGLYDRQRSAEERMILRHKISETIMECHFDADSVQAEAQRERGELEAVRDSLISRRDRTVELNNATNFIASGTLNTVGSVLGFPSNAKPFPGNLNQMLSGVVSTGMSTYALKQSGGEKVRGHTSPTLLAELFGRPVDARSTYPESVWRYVHGKSPDFPDKTRAQMLEARWIQRRHLEPHGSRREAAKLDAVSGMHNKLLSIDDLTDQIAMLSDIANMAALMSHQLRDLLLLIDSDVIE